MAGINTEQRPVAVQRVAQTTSSFSPFETLRRAANEALGGLVGGPAPAAPAAPAAPVAPTLLPYDKKATQARLDEFRGQMKSSYTLPGENGGEPREIKVFPQFQMEGGLNDPEGKSTPKGRVDTMNKVGSVLDLKSNPALRTAASAAGMGRATPQQMQMVTQALIDAGKLPPAKGDHTTDSARVRKLQWDFGLGSDCAGYVAQSATKAAGRDLGLAGVNKTGDSLQGSIKPEHFDRVPQQPGKPMRARAGDVVRLNDPTPGEAGHWVNVYDHTTMNPEKVARMRDTNNDFWKGSAPNSEVHVYTLDSSWGAGGNWKMRGDQGDVGGADRRKWVYNASNDRWGTYDDRAKNPSIVYSEVGPYNHLPDVKVYRPKTADAQ